MRRVKRPKEIPNKGDNGKNNPLLTLPYLPDDECFFDSRHWTYGLLSEELPFAVTTRIDANNQQWLKVYEQNSKR